MMNECHVKKIIVDNQSLETLSINRGFIFQERAQLFTHKLLIVHMLFMKCSCKQVDISYVLQLQVI